MSGSSRSIVPRALLLGVAAGLRSQAPAAMLAWHRNDAPRTASWRNWPVVRSVWGRRVLIASGVGELIGDKLPVTPSRLEPLQLVGRVAFGGLAGAAIGSEGRGKASVIRGAILGTAGAVIGNVGGYHARRAAVEATGLPDPAIAVIEDAAAIALARRAVAVG